MVRRRHGSLPTARDLGWVTVILLVLIGSCLLWSRRVSRDAAIRRTISDQRARIAEDALRSRFEACDNDGRRQLVHDATAACEPHAHDMDGFTRCVSDRLDVCGQYRGTQDMPSRAELFSCERHTRHPDRRCAQERRALARNWRREFDAVLSEWASQTWDWEQYRFTNRHLIEN